MAQFTFKFQFICINLFVFNLFVLSLLLVDAELRFMFITDNLAYKFIIK